MIPKIEPWHIAILDHLARHGPQGEGVMPFASTREGICLAIGYRHPSNIGRRLDTLIRGDLVEEKEGWMGAVPVDLREGVGAKCIRRCYLITDRGRTLLRTYLELWPEAGKGGPLAREVGV